MTSQRRNANGIGTRYTLHEGLPSSFQENSFTDEFVRSFDDVVAPVHAAVDDLDAYVDPRLAPTDFLAWLGGWFGIEVNRRWPIKRRREFVSQAVEAYRLRGTAEGIALAVELYTGISPTVTDNGGVSASPEPLGTMPGSRAKAIVVTVDAAGGVDVDEELIGRIVDDAKPVHMPATVRVVR